MPPPRLPRLQPLRPTPRMPPRMPPLRLTLPRLTLPRLTLPRLPPYSVSFQEKCFESELDSSM